MGKFWVLNFAAVLLVAVACGRQALSDEQLSDLVQAEVETQVAALELPTGPPGPRGPAGTPGAAGQQGSPGEIIGIDKPLPVIQVEGIKVVDANGSVRISLSTDSEDDSGSLVFQDDEGITIQMFTSPDFVGLQLGSKLGTEPAQTDISLAIQENNALLLMTDSNGNAVGLSVVGDTPAIQVNSGSSGSQASLDILDFGARLAFRDENGDTRIVVAAPENGGHFTILDGNGERTATFTSLGSGTGLILLEENTNSRIIVRVRDGEATFTIEDSVGRVLFNAP